MTILRVGLTGGIASGKSSIMRRLAHLGAITVDADAVVARLYEPGNSGHAAIVEAYGHRVLAEDGTIDRRRLADVAFSDPSEARKLNALIHPLVHAEQDRMMREAEAADEDRLFVIEATLLLESGGKSRFDRIVVVDVEPEVQIERAVGRGMTREDAMRRIANQMPREARIAEADYVLDNSGSADDADRETRRVYEALLQDLEEKNRRAGDRPA